MSQDFLKWKLAAFIEMALCEIEWRTNSGSTLVSVKYIILGSFKEGMIILCHITFEMEMMTIWYSLDLLNNILSFTSLSEDLYWFFLPMKGSSVTHLEHMENRLFLYIKKTGKPLQLNEFWRRSRYFLAFPST